MSTQDFVALAPYLALGGGIVLLMLLVSFWRGVRIMLTMTVVVLLVSLGLIGVSIGNPPHLISGFLLIDGYAAVFNALFIIAAIVTALLAHGYMRGRGGEQEEFYLLLALATLGAMTMAAAHHFAAVLLGLEILSISLYVLIGYSEEGHPPLEAALKYLVLSGVASTTMLFGMALIYNATGTLVFSELGSADFAVPRDELYYLAGQGLLFAGIAFKLSLVPFHMWTPDVYQGAPAPVTGFLATVSKGAVFAFVLRYALITDVLAIPALSTVLLMFAVLSMLGGNLLALLQNNVKRLLAYSSIAPSRRQPCKGHRSGCRLVPPWEGPGRRFRCSGLHSRSAWPPFCPRLRRRPPLSSSTTARPTSSTTRSPRRSRTQVHCSCAGCRPSRAR